MLTLNDKLALQLAAKSNPVTAPNLADNICKNTAKQFESNIRKSNLYLKAEPAATAVE